MRFATEYNVKQNMMIDPTTRRLNLSLTSRSTSHVVKVKKGSIHLPQIKHSPHKNKSHRCANCMFDRLLHQGEKEEKTFVIHRKLLRLRHVRKEQLMRMRESNLRQRGNDYFTEFHQDSLEVLTQSADESSSRVTTLYPERSIHHNITETKESLPFCQNSMSNNTQFNCCISIDAKVTEHSIVVEGGNYPGKDGINMLVECLNN